MVFLEFLVWWSVSYKLLALWRLADYYIDSVIDEDRTHLGVGVSSLSWMSTRSFTFTGLQMSYLLEGSNVLYQQTGIYLSVLMAEEQTFTKVIRKKK